MPAPRLFASTDTGAPQIYKGHEGAIRDVLRACLVDGYGSQPPAGWTLAYEDTATYVFRNNLDDGGTGCYVALSEVVTNNLDVWMYRNCTGTGRGDGDVSIPRSSEWEAAATSSTAVRRKPWAYWYDSTSDPLPWSVVADSRFFVWLSPMTRADREPNTIILMCGDYEPIVPVTWHAMIGFRNYYTASYGARNCRTYSGYVMRHYSSSPWRGFEGYVLEEPWTQGVSFVKHSLVEFRDSSPDYDLRYPHETPWGGRYMVVSPVVIYARTETEAVFQHPLGYVPGWHFLAHCCIEAGQALCGWTPGTFATTPTWDDFYRVVTIEGKQYLMVRAIPVPILIGLEESNWRGMV